MPKKTYDRAASRAAREEKTKALLQQLDEGARAIWSSDKFRDYLKMMCKFHRYSYRNVILIHMQCPHATHVAGYNSWIDNFHRHVKVGEKGIQILGYTPYNREISKTVLDANGKPLKDKDGKDVTETSVIRVPAYKPVYVYDVSQTEGEPLPELITPLQGDAVPNYQELFAALAELAPYPITLENISGSANGYCDHGEKKIVVQEGMSQAMTLKTTVHEVAHAREHDPANFPDGERPPRETLEVEAESIAFLVCEYLGIDTSDYSFGYVGAWSSDKDLPELHEALSHIQKAANEIMDKLDETLELIQERATAAPVAGEEVKSIPSVLDNICTKATAQAAKENTAKAAAIPAPEMEKERE